MQNKQKTQKFVKRNKKRKKKESVKTDEYEDNGKYIIE